MDYFSIFVNEFFFSCSLEWLLIKEYLFHIVRVCLRNDQGFEQNVFFLYFSQSTGKNWVDTQ